jgi:hypothetical protein
MACQTGSQTLLVVVAGRASTVCHGVLCRPSGRRRAGLTSDASSGVGLSATPAASSRTGLNAAARSKPQRRSHAC